MVACLADCVKFICIVTYKFVDLQKQKQVCSEFNLNIHETIL